MERKRQKTRIIVGLFFSVMMGLSFAWANDSRQDRAVRRGDTDAEKACSAWAQGGGVPFPFCVSEQKFELAEGEKYMLPGWFRYDSSYRMVFQIDLRAAPHLATAKRAAHPFYRVISSTAAEKAYERAGYQHVHAPFIARSRNVKDSGTIRPEIFLEVSPDVELRFQEQH